jgi:hypothetical protein
MKAQAAIPCQLRTKGGWAQAFDSAPALPDRGRSCVFCKGGTSFAKSHAYRLRVALDAVRGAFVRKIGVVSRDPGGA